MGAGIHGGFGSTMGSAKLNNGYSTSLENKSITKEQLIDFLDGKTTQSSQIADGIRKGNIKISVLGDELFDRYFGVDRDVLGLAYGNKIYLRRSSSSLFSDLVHEGTHSLDFLAGIPESKISGWEGEIKAYTA